MNEYIKFITKNTKTPTSLVTACRCFYVHHDFLWDGELIDGIER